MSRRTTYPQALAAISAIKTSLHGSESTFNAVLGNLDVLESYISNPDKQVSTPETAEKSEFINVDKACEAAKSLVNDHWSYLEQTLNAHGTDADDTAIAKHHYISSGLHFYKHALEAVNAGEFD